jgi:alanine dehydrogenase
MISKKDIYATLGDIIVGRKKGRVGKREITIFDSTGLAIQDIAVANLVYKKACESKKGKWIKIL